MRRQLLWNAAGNILYLGAQWAVTVLVTVLGGLSDAGVLSVAMSVSATFQTVAMFGIRSFQVSDAEGKYSNTTYVGLRTLTCAAALAACLLFSLVSGYLGGQLLAVFLFMLFRLAECFSDVLHGIAQRQGRLDIAGKSFAVKGAGLLVCFLAVYWPWGSLNAALLSMSLFSCASTLLYDLPAVRRLAAFGLLDALPRCLHLARETLPLCVYLFLYAALTTVPKLILEKQSGGDVLGAYSSIFAPAMLVQAAAGYLYNPFAPAFARLRLAGDRRGFGRLLLKLSLVILAAFAAVLLLALPFGEPVLILVFGEQIRPFCFLLMPILWVNAAVSYLGFLSMVVIVLRGFRWLLAGYAAGFLICLLATAPAIGWLGPNGASYSIIAACAVAILVLAAGVICGLHGARRPDGTHKEDV